MLDPKEVKKDGFRAFAARFREQQTARHPAPNQEEPAATTPGSAAPAATDAVLDPKRSR